jgi:hypothetical protein
MRVLGVVLLVLGVLAIVYGGFWYTKEEKVLDVGPVEVHAERKERLNVPLWAGVVATVVGAALLFSPRRG